MLLLSRSHTHHGCWLSLVLNLFWRSLCACILAVSSRLDDDPDPHFLVVACVCVCVSVSVSLELYTCICMCVWQDMQECVVDRIEAGAIEISVVLYKWSTCSYTHAHPYTHRHTHMYHTCVTNLSQCVHHVFCLFRLYLWVFPLTQLSYVCFDFCFRVELTAFQGRGQRTEQRCQSLLYCSFLFRLQMNCWNNTHALTCRIYTDTHIRRLRGNSLCAEAYNNNNSCK